MTKIVFVATAVFLFVFCIRNKIKEKCLIKYKKKFVLPDEGYLQDSMTVPWLVKGKQSEARMKIISK